MLYSDVSFVQLFCSEGANCEACESINGPGCINKVLKNNVTFSNIFEYVQDFPQVLGVFELKTPRSFLDFLGNPQDKLKIIHDITHQDIIFMF